MSNDIILFNPTEVATLGNKFLGAIVAHEIAKEEAEGVLQQASKRENFIDVELIKALIHLQSAEEIDLYKIYGDNKESASLYRQILVSLGVLKRTITDKDEVIYAFTDASLENQFHFPASMNDAKKDTETAEEYLARTTEYTRRRSRRNSLNIRLARVAKASIALIEAGATTESLEYRQTESGETQVVLTKGPADVVGKKGEVVIVSGNAAKAEGASQTPTISGLAKVADAGHKEVKAAKPASGEGATRKETDGDKSGDENDFLAMVNAMIMTVKGRENVFADAEKIALSNLAREIAAVGVKTAKSEPAH